MVFKCFKEAFIKYGHFKRVSMDKKEENEKYFRLEILIITLVGHV